MELRTAIEKLHDAVKLSTGASSSAATVLLFGYSEQPMRKLLRLDAKNRAAAMTVIEAALNDDLDGGRVIEMIVGSDAIVEMYHAYGEAGTAWRN